MTLKIALEIVLDIASENTFESQIETESDKEDKSVKSLIEEQNEAIEIVGKYLENWPREGNRSTSGT